MPLDNATPTILSASELPSHRQKRAKKEVSQKEHVVRDLFMARDNYATLDPYYLSDSDTESDDSSVEAIDEQEIYGGYTKALFSTIYKCLGFLPVQSEDSAFHLV